MIKINAIRTKQITAQLLNIKGDVKDMGKIMKQTQKHRVYVGIPSDAPDYPDGTDVVMVATIHEYGSEEHDIVPKRFIRSTIEDNRQSYIDFLHMQANLIMKNKTDIDTSLRLVGEIVRGDIQMRIRNDKWERWAYERKDGVRKYKKDPETKKRYREMGPLIDTGHLRQSITYKVE